MTEHLQGRIIALEIFMRSEIVGLALKERDPAGYIKFMKDALLTDFHSYAPNDPYSQKVMDEAKNALVHTFDQAALRLKGA
ncbi:hypothetical protein [Mesorhizobium sp. BR-1-1-10]|uniref:hypothetical protein n=1 Tax=Mesorhizobium sp. BR-1-1-10 TaxID=2876660 RepID=UPI001CD0AFCC|nr:hypothetical protein [Mesorhizobium sp. BR-1-1-10]MBZ9976137.1 hypothetical protein [Mesorhizobium sp. BR-1-1-10]